MDMKITWIHRCAGIVVLCFLAVLFNALDSEMGKELNVYHQNTEEKVMIRPMSPRVNTNCILPNVCKKNPNNRLYNYTRHPDFYKRALAPVDLEDNGTRAENVVPNIVHFISFARSKGQNNFEFHHMLSVLSAHKFIKPEKLLFWLDEEPTSKYWKELLQKVPSIILVYKEKPKEVLGQKVEIVEHSADVLRLELMLEFGGMYFDLDVMILRSFDPLRKYDFTMGHEIDYALCNAVLISKPWATFARIWYQQYRRFNDSEWSAHSVLLPHTLSIQFPNMIHEEEMYFHHPNYNEREFLYEEGKLWDWRKLNYASHLFAQYYTNRKNATEIKTWDTTAGEMFRYIYYGDWRIRHD